MDLKYLQPLKQETFIFVQWMNTAVLENIWPLLDYFMKVTPEDMILGHDQDLTMFQIGGTIPEVTFCGIEAIAGRKCGLFATQFWTFRKNCIYK